MRRAAAAGVVIAALLAGACAGDSAKDKWVKASVKACDTRFRAVEVASAQLTATSTPEQFAAWFTQFFEPAYRAQLQAQGRHRREEQQGDDAAGDPPRPALHPRGQPGEHARRGSDVAEPGEGAP